MFLSIKPFNKKAYIDFYKKYQNGLRKTNNIIYDQIFNNDLNLTFYKNGTILLNGNLSNEVLKNIEILIDKTLYIGSDEVGVGENVGPIVVCGLKFKSFESKKKVILNGLKDSKKMTFIEINKLAEVLKKESISECKIITPKEFNKIHSKENNIKVISAILHNEVHLFFDKKLTHVIDQFVSKEKYKSYLDFKKIKHENLDSYIFTTNGEEKYAEIAGAAILAKNIFNKWMVDYCLKNKINLEIKKRLNSNKVWEDIKSKKITIKNENEFIKKWKD